MRYKMMTLVWIVTLLLAACQPIQAPAPDAAPPEPPAADVVSPALPPIRTILLVGNGFLDETCCVDRDLVGLMASAVPAKDAATKLMTTWDATLQTHYRYMPYLAPAEVARGNYDVVVLQDDIPIYSEKTVDLFGEMVRLFDADIQNAGGRTVLLMAPAYPSVAPLDWITLDEIAEAHRTIGDELGILVAPAALAMRQAEAEQPDLAMMGGGGETAAMSGGADMLPSVAGVYLTAAVLYATLFDEDPTGLTYRPEGLSEENASFLQQVAWEAVQAWNSVE